MPPSLRSPSRTEAGGPGDLPGVRHQAQPLCGCPTCAVQAAYTPHAARSEQKQSPEPAPAPERKSIPFPGRKEGPLGEVSDSQGGLRRLCSDRAIKKAVIDRESRTQM